MKKRWRLFVGAQLRKLRQDHGLRQADLAKRLEISASYLSQLEHDDRPLTPRVIERLTKAFPLEWQDFGAGEADHLALALTDATADPLFDEPITRDAIAHIAEQHPAFANRFIEMHEIYRRTSQRLEMVDEAIAVDNSSGARLPWEEVRDWFHLSNNYVDSLDRSAENLALSLCPQGVSPGEDVLVRHLGQGFGISVKLASGGSLRRFDAASKELTIESAQPTSGRRFQMAYQLATQALGTTIDAIALGAELRSNAARELLRVGLANYAAGALLMPYARFQRAARDMRHDVDRLGHSFGVSFEQTCHRLSTLQRENMPGLPVFFCRVDMAGNITKRHSATQLQFARFGGACPLWIVHEAVAIPDRILVQLSETADGARYVSMAKGIVKPSGRFDRAPRRYAVALGCDAKHAASFVYADGLDVAADAVATRIGISCRICPRPDCDQRAYPPSDQQIGVDLHQRGIVPYQMK